MNMENIPRVRTDHLSRYHDGDILQQAYPSGYRLCGPLLNLPPDITAKWSASVLSEGFVPFPKKLLRTLSSLFGSSAKIEDLMVLLSISDFKRANQTRHPRIDYLSFVSGLSEEKIRASFERMEEREFLTYALDEMDGYVVDHSKLMTLIDSTANEGI